MKRRRFLQYIGLGSFIGIHLLYKTTQVSTNNIINDSANYQLCKLGDLSKNSNLYDNFTFDNFVICSSNELAASVSLHASNTPNKAYNPLFLYGETGIGKTHLMHAIGNRMLQLNPEAKIRYIHSERFVSHMIKALRDGALDEFRQSYHSLDAIFIDDVHFLSDKDRSQTEFSNLLSVLIEKGSQIVLTGNQYPYAIEAIGDQLRSYMGRGLTLCVYPPEKSTRLSIAHKKANEYGASLPNDVALILANLFQTNIHELEGAVRRVVITANITGKSITPNIVKETMWDMIISKAEMNQGHGIKVNDDYRNRFVSSFLAT